MYADCHIHMVLDGVNWKAAIARHRQQPDRDYIRKTLEAYRNAGFTFLRDGGDRWGVGQAARELAAEYGITYRTPLAPLCAGGHYGGLIGERYDSLKAYAELVRKQKAQGADFIKIMISGIMDFDHFGVLTEPGLDGETIRCLVDIAHQAGLAVMAHANGSRVVIAAAQAGVDSVEHGAYLNPEALEAMKTARTVWVPTLSTIGNLRNRGRFSEPDVEEILKSAVENVRVFHQMGGILAPGTDAGAWAVPHGTLSEYALLREALGEDADAALADGIREIRDRFRRI